MLERSPAAYHHPLQCRTHSGFTLLELAVVIVVIGLLTTSAFSLYVDMTFRTKVAVAQQVMALFNAAMTRREMEVAVNGGTTFLGPDYQMNSFDADELRQLWPMNQAPYNPIVDGEGFVPNTRAMGGGANVCGNQDGALSDAEVCGHLEFSVSMGCEWMYFPSRRRIYATTPDCSKVNPATW